MLIGWIVRYDGFIFGSNCSWGRKVVVCRCRTWKRNSGSTCQNHFILCQTNPQYQSNYFLDKKNWKSDSDRHCDVIFGFYMVKFVVKWPSEVKTWYLQPRSTPIFFSLVPIANGLSIHRRNFKKIESCGFLPPLWRNLKLKITKLVVKCTAAVIPWIPPSKADCSPPAFGFQVKVPLSTYNRRSM